MKFPTVLRTALRSNKVSFPDTLQCNYEKRCVFRAVKYTQDKTEIDASDFLSYVESNKKCPMIPVVDDNDISSYGCSCFMNLEMFHYRTKFPTKKKAIAKGMINDSFGPIIVDEKTSHIDLFLYDGIDPSGEFEVIEKWEKNG